MTTTSTVGSAVSLLEGQCALVCTSGGLMALYLRRVLQQAGVAVECLHTTADEALTCWQQKQPPLVLLDTESDWQASLWLAEKILAQQDACIVLLASQQRDFTPAAEIGVTGLIVKPLTGPDLLHALARFWEVYTLRQLCAEVAVVETSEGQPTCQD